MTISAFGVDHGGDVSKAFPGFGGLKTGAQRMNAKVANKTRKPGQVRALGAVPNQVGMPRQPGLSRNQKIGIGAGAAAGGAGASAFGINQRNKNGVSKREKRDLAGTRRNAAIIGALDPTGASSAIHGGVTGAKGRKGASAATQGFSTFGGGTVGGLLAGAVSRGKLSSLGASAGGGAGGYYGASRNQAKGRTNLKRGKAR